MAKRFDSISKNNKNINILTSIFKDDTETETPVTSETPVTLGGVVEKKSDVIKRKSKKAETLVTPVISITQKKTKAGGVTPKISKTPITSITQNDDSVQIVQKELIVTSETSVTPIIQSSTYVRQTIIVSTDDLDLLRNLVYTKRLEGKINYTQKEALQEVIAYFKLHHKNIKERPQEIRDEEAKRSENIIKGKK